MKLRSNEEQTAHLQTALLHGHGCRAGPDTNRSAGLHSFSVVALWRDIGLVELTRRRSDLWMHLRAHVLGKIVVIGSGVAGLSAAVSAQEHGAILVTRNIKDFPAEMPGIRVPYTL